MKQIAAIPYENGQVFGHYGKTQAFLIATIEAGKLVTALSCRRRAKVMANWQAF